MYKLNFSDCSSI